MRSRVCLYFFSLIFLTHGHLRIEPDRILAGTGANESPVNLSIASTMHVGRADVHRYLGPQFDFNEKTEDCDPNDLECIPMVEFISTQQGITYHLNGEPKSGTTWLKFIIAGLAQRHCIRDETCSFSLRNRVVHGIVNRSSRPEDFLIDVGGKHEIPIADKLGKQHGGGFDFSQAPQYSAQLITRHVKELLSSDSTTRWVCIIRDPRDVLVSSCHHKSCAQIEKSTQLVSSCYHAGAGGDCTNFVEGKYRNAVNWIKLRYDVFSSISQETQGERAHIIFYESLKKDFDGEARRLAEFLRFNVSQVDIDVVENNTSIEMMKELERKRQVHKGGARQKVRKGEHCAFTADISEQVANAITQYMDDSLPDALKARWRC